LGLKKFSNGVHLKLPIFLAPEHKKKVFIRPLSNKTYACVAAWAVRNNWCRFYWVSNYAIKILRMAHDRNHLIEGSVMLSSICPCDTPCKQTNSLFIIKIGYCFSIFLCSSIRNYHLFVLTITLLLSGKGARRSRRCTRVRHEKKTFEKFHTSRLIYVSNFLTETSKPL